MLRDWLSRLTNITTTPQEPHTTFQERLLLKQFEREDQRAQMMFELQKEELQLSIAEKRARVHRIDRDERFLEAKREQMRANRKAAPKKSEQPVCTVCENPYQIGLTAAQITWHNGGHGGQAPAQDLKDPNTGRIINGLDRERS